MWGALQLPACSTRSVLVPEAVLHDEDEEEQDAGAESGRTEAAELCRDRVLQVADAGVRRLAKPNLLTEVEQSGLANTGA